jgi:hypothetical protein
MGRLDSNHELCCNRRPPVPEFSLQLPMIRHKPTQTGIHLGTIRHGTRMISLDGHLVSYESQEDPRDYGAAA